MDASALVQLRVACFRLWMIWCQLAGNYLGLGQPNVAIRIRIIIGSWLVASDSDSKPIFDAGLIAQDIILRFISRGIVLHQWYTNLLER